jgi:protein YIPF6
MSNDPPNETKMQFINAPNSNFSDLEGDLAPSGQTKQTNATSQKSKGFTSINLNNFIGAPPLPTTNNSQIPYISTLDEPVSVTISRDFKAVAYKLGHVFLPKKSTLLLKEWDLWGPLSLCVLLSITLQGSELNNSSSNAPEFASVFALIALGAIIVTINTKLLSGKVSFFQSICVLGYCLLPLVLVSMLNDVLIWIFGITTWSFAVRFVLVFVSFGWSVFASTAFLAADTLNLTDRKLLAVFPIFLFYFVISWLIILHTK